MKQQPPFVAVEGPIGVGKTSLARAIANNYTVHLVEEIAEANPFLGKFYDDMEDWSFQTEMFFLCNRFKQLEDIDQRYLQKNNAVVADYHVFKNRIFAARTLKEEHAEKYEQIYRILTDDLPTPNIVIYLTASVDTLVQRVAQRGREVEKNLDPSYLQAISRDYEAFIDTFQTEHPNIPVLRYNGDDIDFVSNPKNIDTVLGQLQPILQAKGLS